VGEAIYNDKYFCREEVVYLNRTWEKFEYESLLLEIIQNNFNNYNIKKYTNIIRNLKG
jgi:hypothetical protein